MKDTMQVFAQGTPRLKEGVAIRKATKEDVPAIVSMIKVQWFIYRTSGNLWRFASANGGLMAIVCNTYI